MDEDEEEDDDDDEEGNGSLDFNLFFARCLKLKKKKRFRRL